MKTAKPNSTINANHLLTIVLFLFTFAFRLLAASRLNVTIGEGSMFLNLIKTQETTSYQGALLYQLLTKPLVAFFGDSTLVLRFWTILASSLLIILPLFLLEKIGNRVALLFSILIVLDPFQIANGLQAHGHAITLLILSIVVVLLLQKRLGVFIWALMGLLFSLQGSAFLVLILLVGFLIVLNKQSRETFGSVIDNEVEAMKKKASTYSIAAFVLLLILFLFGIRISDPAGEIISFVNSWFKSYSNGNSAQLYPLVLMAYFPLIFVLFFARKNQELAILHKYFGSWMVLALMLISLYPGHQLLDLVWVSYPASFLIALRIDAIIKTYDPELKKTVPYPLIMLCLLISLVICATILLYQTRLGLNVSGSVISLISLLAFLTVIAIIIATSESLHLTARALGSAIFIVLLVFQLTFSWRSTGLTGDPAGEVLWGGYFEDADLLEKNLYSAYSRRKGTEIPAVVLLKGNQNPAVKWVIASAFEIDEYPVQLKGKHYFAAITGSADDMTVNGTDGYYGQDFIATSYPLWTWQPWRELLNTDFWSWAVWRQGQMFKENDVLWVNKILF